MICLDNKFVYYIDNDARVPIKHFFGFILVKNHFGHESRDDYVTVDNIEFNQNTLSNSAPTHTIGPMKYK